MILLQPKADSGNEKSFSHKALQPVEPSALRSLFYKEKEEVWVSVYINLTGAREVCQRTQIIKCMNVFAQWSLPI